MRSTLDRAAALLAFRPRALIATFAPGAATSTATATTAASVWIAFAAVLPAFPRFTLRAAILAAETALATLTAVTTATASTAMSALAMALIAFAARRGGRVALGLGSGRFATAENSLEPAHEPAGFLFRLGHRLGPALRLRLRRAGL